MATKSDIIKFINDEIAETETALGFVEGELSKKTTTQFNATYQRKRAEYSGVLWALNAVLDVAEGRVKEDEEAEEQTKNG